eukprot:GHVO01050103.1.p1 GENE.GHVO01050103.1~~GHVO01050103.1.p1  ORF type:complete len:450 (+),score=75.31 GHVO01050103.1:188-1537(+)
MTLSIGTHATWIIRPLMSMIDTDNIRHADTLMHGNSTSTPVVSAEYVLSRFVLEGLAKFPLKYYGNDDVVIVDIKGADHPSVVIQNGYFQLQTGPVLGELTTIEGSGYTLPRQTAAEVVSYIHTPMQADFAEAPPDPHASTPYQIYQTVKGGIKSTLGFGRAKQDVINVFTVASGRMYERLLRIMITSLRRHSNSNIKIWLLDDFLSPHFKTLMPKIAEKLEIDYQYVSYRWPSWLRSQTVKQRQIWGTKILFLDVLFPPEVERIIFIDADQVVRADIKELWDIDLRGKVYGFVPFCDDKRETDGFRFWKQGYWETYLRGKTYHISALFLIDLQAYRHRRAGNYLRDVYNTLSVDPNSLSNLDQDLPNYAQHDIPIHSLPQEWLWCETWCSEESKKRAKTIDLCNNPLTKEHKLRQAARILNEWTGYNQEIENLENALPVDVNTKRDEL